MHKSILALEGTRSLHFQLYIPEIIMDNEVNGLASAGIGNDTSVVFKLYSAAFRFVSLADSIGSLTFI